jgi:hypothetical protein
MTKEQYFEMCEMLGSEPLEEEIPVEVDDLPDFVQTGLQIYHLLSDVWEGMSGTYMGKDLSNIFKFMELYEVEKVDQLLLIGYIRQMDSFRSQIIHEKQKASKASSPKA